MFLVSVLSLSLILVALVHTYGVSAVHFSLIDPLVVDTTELSTEPPPGQPSQRVAASRPRRATCGVDPVSSLTAAQKTESLNAHNAVRRRDGADQLQLAWDDVLASRAQEWTNNCDFSHSLLTDCQNVRVGQNGFLTWTTGTCYPALNMTTVVESWASEKNNWDFTNKQCNASSVCGHWTQVVWSRTSRVGCGATRCPIVNQTGSTQTWNRALIVFCDYSVAGNVVGQLPYIEGTSCSSCYNVTRSMTTTPGYKCVNNLCVPCSPASDANCQCGPATSCLNGGVWNTGTCRCVCPTGFYGESCQKPCVDTETQANCIYWKSLGYCATSSQYYAFMTTNCAKTCGICQ